MRISKRMKAIKFSGIRKVFEEIGRREQAGEKIIHLEIGRPDFDTPLHIKEKAKWALDKGFVHYTSNYGLPQLRAAISDKLSNDNGLTYNPDKEIIVTVGANEAVFLAMMALVDPGDEVLIPSPCWTHYYECTRLCSGIPVPVPLHRENNYRPVIDDLEQRVTAKTKLLVVNTPHNPTGAVYDMARLKELAAFAEKHDLYVLSDEIYEKLIYGTARHHTIASLPNMRERTIIVNGHSKIYAMTGWRLGYTAAPETLSNAMIRVHQYTSVCATTFAQYGGVEALNGPQESVVQMVQEFDRRRLLVYSRLQAMPGIEVIKPEGAFYILPYIEKLGMSPELFCEYLLDKAKIAVVPGDAFGDFANGTIRISYANSYENLTLAMDRMESAINAL